MVHLKCEFTQAVKWLLSHVNELKILVIKKKVVSVLLEASSNWNSRNLNQIFVSLIRPEQTSTIVATFISMYLFICQFSKRTWGNLISLGLNDVKAEEEKRGKKV